MSGRDCAQGTVIQAAARSKRKHGRRLCGAAVFAAALVASAMCTHGEITVLEPAAKGPGDTLALTILPGETQAAAALGGGQRQFVAIFIETLAHRCFDSRYIGVRQALFPAAERIDFFFRAFFAKRRIRFRQTAQAGALNPVVVQIVIDKAAEFAERFARVGDQVFIADLDVVGRELAAMGAALVNHPLPIQRSRHQAFGLAAVPGQRSEAPHFLERERNVAAVADDVHKKRVGQVALHALDVQHTVGIVHRPALHLLAPCHRVHDDTDEVSPGAAVVQDARRQLLRIEAGAPETLAAEPGFDELFAVRAAFHGAEAGNQSPVNWQKPAVNGKPAGRQQHVVKQVRPRAVAAHYEDRSIFAIA